MQLSAIILNFLQPQKGREREIESEKGKEKRLDKKHENPLAKLTLHDLRQLMDTIGATCTHFACVI